MSANAYDLKAMRLAGDALAAIRGAPRAYCCPLALALAANLFEAALTSNLEIDSAWGYVIGSFFAPIVLLYYLMFAWLASSFPTNDWRAIAGFGRELREKAMPIAGLAVFLAVASVLFDLPFNSFDVLYTLPFLLPATYIWLRLSLAVVVMVCEGGGAISVLRRSWELTRRKVWTLFKLQLVVYLPLIGMIFLIGTVAVLASAEGDTTDKMWYLSAAFVFLGAVASMVETVALALYYQRIAPQPVPIFPDFDGQEAVAESAG